MVNMLKVFSKINDKNLNTYIGSITKEITLKWPDLQKLPEYKLTSAFHCVTQWSKINNEWKGILISTLIEFCDIKDFPNNITVHCYGGYTTNVQYTTLNKNKAKGLLSYAFGDV